LPATKGRERGYLLGNFTGQRIGGIQLAVKELLIDDSGDSNALLELRKDIENRTGWKIEEREVYDE
jgi:hypothetical protein